MTRLTDEQFNNSMKLIFDRCGPYAESLIKEHIEAIEEELKQSRADIATLQEELKESDSLLLESNETLVNSADELKKCRLEIKSLQDQLRTLRENRFHASGLLDCKAENERLRKALEDIATSEDLPKTLTTYSLQKFARNALEKGNG